MEGREYPTDVFEARNPNGVYLPRTGEEAIALRIFHSTKPADGVPSDPADVGFFSILDLPTAVRFNLPIAELTNGCRPTGRRAYDRQHPAPGTRPMTTANGFHVPAPAPSDPGAWPLVKVDHALVPQAQTRPR